MTDQDQNQLITVAVDDAVEFLLLDDRTDDPELPVGAIEERVYAWDITIADIVLLFEESLRRRIPGPRGYLDVPEADESTSDGEAQATQAPPEQAEVQVSAGKPPTASDADVAELLGIEPLEQGEK